MVNVPSQAHIRLFCPGTLQYSQRPYSRGIIDCVERIIAVCLTSEVSVTLCRERNKKRSFLLGNSDNKLLLVGLEERLYLIFNSRRSHQNVLIGCMLCRCLNVFSVTTNTSIKTGLRRSCIKICLSLVITVTFK